MTVFRFVSFALLFTACGTPAPTATPQVASTDASPEGTGAAAAEPELTAVLPRQLAAFDYTWKTIRDKHWDTSRVGAAWDAARTELRPKVAAAKTADEARAVIRELIARLGQSHFGLSSPTPSKGPASIPARLRLIGGELVVVATEAGAEKALKPGLAIVSVDGEAVADELVKIREKLVGSTMKGVHEHGSVVGMLAGPTGSAASLEVVTPKGKKQTIEVKRVLPTGKMARFGQLSGIPVEYESRWVNKSVGYIRLSIFFDPVTVNGRFRDDIKRFAKAKGIVIDLRGNPGGIGAMAAGMAGRLVKESGKKLGTTISRDSRVDDVINPQPGAYGGRVAVLIDGLCGSTCEIFSAGLAELGRARLFGTTTAGAALPSAFEQLPSGDLLQYAVANYVTASGKTLEGNGVEPTVRVELDKKSLWAGKDPQLDAATAWIRKGETK